jgi:hypothetical protein
MKELLSSKDMEMVTAIFKVRAFATIKIQETTEDLL